MASDRVKNLIDLSGGEKFTIGEIAQASGYTEFTTRRHIAEGKLRSVKVAGRRYVLKKDAVVYLSGIADQSE